MNKLLIILLFLPVLWSCDNSSYTAANDAQNQEEPLGDQQNQEVNLNENTPTELSNAFCANQNQLQVLSTSLLSAYSVKGNGADLNYCGGEIDLNEDGLSFDITITDYCVNARGQEVTLNGNVTGLIEGLLIVLALFIVVFGFRTLWSPPPKHKNFSYLDQQRAMNAFNRTDLIKFTLANRKKMKHQRHK